MARIYIADDDAHVREVLLGALGDEGHDVTAVPDGSRVRDAMIAQPPDLLILDTTMPGLDGYQVMKGMEKWGVREGTRVLVVSAKASEDDRGKAYDGGADQFMTKPFDVQELLVAVRELLSLSKEELKERRQTERDKARLLSQLESLFGTEGRPRASAGE